MCSCRWMKPTPTLLLFEQTPVVPRTSLSLCLSLARFCGGYDNDTGGDDDCDCSSNDTNTTRIHPHFNSPSSYHIRRERLCVRDARLQQHVLVRLPLKHAPFNRIELMPLTGIALCRSRGGGRGAGRWKAFKLRFTPNFITHLHS